MSIQNELLSITGQLPASTRLVAVSKFQPLEKIQEAYRAGQRVFGESRVQELCQKHEILPDDIQWHFIGHLQSNKIRQIVPFVSMIHAVDTPQLLEAIDREASRTGRVVPCLLEIHIAMESSKFGFSPTELEEYLQGGHWKSLSHIQICGLMGMATFTDDEAQIRREFQCLKDCFDRAKTACFAEEPSFCELSMGMSDDYPIALEYGSTYVRIGTKIFGART